MHWYGWVNYKSAYYQILTHRISRLVLYVYILVFIITGSDNINHYIRFYFLNKTSIILFIKILFIFIGSSSKVTLSPITFQMLSRKTYILEDSVVLQL